MEEHLFRIQSESTTIKDLGKKRRLDPAEHFVCVYHVSASIVWGLGFELRSSGLTSSTFNWGAFHQSKCYY